MSNHDEDDLDLLLSLNDRVQETPPASPSTSHPNSPGYLSDDERRERNVDTDMSVFRSAVADCIDYDAETAKRALKSKPLKISNEPGIEKYSGLKIRNQLVSAEELSSHFADIRFVRLPVIKNLIVGDTLSGCWATVGVLVEKGASKTSTIGKSYSLWKIGCLDEQTISVFLFGNAYQRHSDESAGSVFAFFNAGVRKDPKGAGFSLSVSSADQILKIGTSVDYGVCKGQRRDGTACTMAVNRRHGIYCSFHRSKTSKEYSKVRSVLQGGNLKTAFREHHKSEGIYMVDRLSERKNSTNSKQPMKLLSVQGLKKALSNAVNVTTNVHSQGIRFLNEIAGRSDQNTSKNEPTTLQRNPKSGLVKRSSSAVNMESFEMRGSQGVKRVKAEPQAVSSGKPKTAPDKMIVLDIVSSDEEP